MKTNMKPAVKAVIFAAFAPLVAIGWTTEPVGFKEQCQKQLWVTYRSFNKEFERTAQFAAMGITNRCFFAANTINGGGESLLRIPAHLEGLQAI